MALGDGIRRDISKVSQAERDRFIAAIVKLDTTKFFPDGVSYWDKQEDIHKNAHFHGVDVHFGPAFIPWHRVITNRLEQLLREVDPELSLHYWDWTSDPRSTNGGRVALFTDNFMDNASGDVKHLLKDFESSEGAETGNGHDKVWRDVAGTAANPDGTPALASDATILSSGNDFASFGAALKAAHDNTAHSYIGGTITNPHYSFHDPFVFLLHSNVDRLWAAWQTAPGKTERMTPATAYSGLSPTDQTTLATENVEPWAGGTGLDPWASDPTKRAVITYTDISVVAPPCYDTNGSTFEIVTAENPLNGATNRNQIIFNDVPEEETTWRSATFKVYACGDVTMRVRAGTEPGAPFSVVTPSVLTHQGAVPFREIRVWFGFTAGAVGTAPQNIGPVNTTIECVENGQSFDFELVAHTIHRPTVAVQLVLDQSGSMAWPAGTTGATRLQVLVDAADLFANLIQRNNGIGLIRFDDDAYPPDDATYPGMFIAKVQNDGFGDPTRVQALNAIAAHGAHGNTSIGDGLAMGRTQLNNLPVGSYDDKAIILFTDGLENTPAMIADVAGMIDDRVYAVGLGNEAQVNTQALTALAGSTGGFLMLSGLLSSSLDDQFRLRKFFLQILAGVTKTSIVRDPVGYINIGQRLRIPFLLSEADISARVISLTDFPIVDLAVETPDGKVIDAGNAAAYGVEFDRSSKITTARFTLPLDVDGNPEQAGMWYAVLEIDERRIKEWLKDQPRTRGTAGGTAMTGAGARYCLSIHSFSNLRMNTTLSQTGFTPGESALLRTTLSEYQQPVAHRASVVANVTHPDGTSSPLTLDESADGVFAAAMPLPIAGIYRFHVIAEGGTYRGTPFSREQIANAAVWTGGDQPDQSLTGGGTRTSDWCRWLECLMSEHNLSGELQDRLMKEGLNIHGLRRCLEVLCRGGQERAPE